MQAKSPKPITAANVLRVLPASPADILMYLDYPDGAFNSIEWDELYAMTEAMAEEGLAWGAHRTADDPVWHATERGRAYLAQLPPYEEAVAELRTLVVVLGPDDDGVPDKEVLHIAREHKLSRSQTVALLSVEFDHL